MEVYPAYPIGHSTECTEKIGRRQEILLQMHARSSNEVHLMAEQSDLEDNDSPLQWSPFLLEMRKENCRKEYVVYGLKIRSSEEASRLRMQKRTHDLIFTCQAHQLSSSCICKASCKKRTSFSE